MVYNHHLQNLNRQKQKNQMKKKPKPKSKSKSKSKPKTKSKPPTIPVPKPTSTLKAPTKHDTVPSGSEYEEDDEFEYYYEEEEQNNNEPLDGNETQPMETSAPKKTTKKLLFPGLGGKNKVKSVSVDTSLDASIGTTWQ
eukprot:995029_1